MNHLLLYHFICLVEQYNCQKLIPFQEVNVYYNFT